MKSVLLTGLLIVASVFSQSTKNEKPKKEFPALRSSYESGNVFKLHITSEVSRWDSLIREESLAKLTDEERDQVTLFIYTYMFQNSGTKKIKFVFSNRDVLMSPLTQILQDFSIMLEPRQTRTVKFAATTEPILINTSQVNQEWNGENKKWYSHSSSGTTLYIPRWNTIWIEMAE